MTFSMNSKFALDQLVEVEIEELVQGGEGLAKIDNFAIFVPQGIPGDRLEIKIISLKPNYARGLINKIIEPSEFRIKPPCPVTDECGGCQPRHL